MDSPNRRAVLQVVGKRVNISLESEWGDCPLCTRIVAIGAPGAVATFKGEDAGLGTLPAYLRKVLVISYAGLGGLQLSARSVSPRPCVCSRSAKGVILPSVPLWRGQWPT